MNKERLAQCKETLRRNKFFDVLDIIEQLERENEILERILIGEQMEQEALSKEIERLRDELDKRLVENEKA